MDSYVKQVNVLINALEFNVLLDMHANKENVFQLIHAPMLFVTQLLNVKTDYVSQKILA
jgi:hypothetical protein